jgi:hypothetical protein
VKQLVHHIFSHPQVRPAVVYKYLEMFRHVKPECYRDVPVIDTKEKRDELSMLPRKLVENAKYLDDPMAAEIEKATSDDTAGNFALTTCTKLVQS